MRDYEEGMFTPGVTVGGGSTGVTYAAANVGTYTKIGRMVFVTGHLILTSKGSSPTPDDPSDETPKGSTRR